MSRLYQKSLIASSGIHALLGLILFVGPAFLTSKPKASDIQPITFFPSILIDAPFANPGGSSGNRAPTPAPAPPPPLVQPAPAPPPQPTKQPTLEVAPPKSKEPSLEVTKENGRKKPEISLTPVIRSPNGKSTSKDTSAEDRLAMRQKMLGQFDRTIRSIGSGTGSATRIDEDFGGGDGSGPSYASYASWVWSYFDRAWVRPEDASMEDATVEASVTIARDGTVVAKRIVKRSGDAAVDASVQRALDKVSTVGRPFPEGAKDKERTYIIPFNMKSKRGAA